MKPSDCKLIIPLFSLLLLAHPRTSYSQVVSATIINFGQIEHTAEEQATETAIESDDSHTGSLFVMHPDMVPTFMQVKNKSKINLRLGVQFGIEVQLNGAKVGHIVPVKTRWTHPKFKDGVTVEEWPSPMNIGYGRYAGWVIENESELVPGNWMVEILFKGKVIARQTFELE